MCEIIAIDIIIIVSSYFCNMNNVGDNNLLGPVLLRG